MVRSPLLSLAAAAALALATAAGAIRAQAAVPPGTWQVLRSVSPDPTKVDNSLFAGVSMASTNDGWAVGSFANPQAVNQPLAEHWDGQAWRITANVPLPKGAASGELSGVNQLSSASAWAVGDATPASGGARTLIEQFTGTSWAVVPSPDPFTGTGADDRLNGISGSSAHDLWAVGFAFDGNNIALALLEHFNGTQWQSVAPPAVGGFPDLVSVSADSPSDAWAVGTTATPNDTSLAVHWNGHAWKVVAVPCLQGGTVSVGCTAINVLTGVSAPTASNVWVSGYEEGGSESLVPYVLHWNGKAWSLTKTPNLGDVGSSLKGSLLCRLATSGRWGRLRPTATASSRPSPSTSTAAHGHWSPAPTQGSWATTPSTAWPAPRAGNCSPSEPTPSPGSAACGPWPCDIPPAEPDPCASQPKRSGERPAAHQEEMRTSSRRRLTVPACLA